MISYVVPHTFYCIPLMVTLYCFSYILMFAHFRHVTEEIVGPYIYWDHLCSGTICTVTCFVYKAPLSCCVKPDKQVPTVLSVVGAKTYSLLRSPTALDLPQDKSFEELVSALQSHFEPKLLLIAERFHFTGEIKPWESQLQSMSPSRSPS